MKVIRIEEDNEFGCEERPADSPVCALVTLENQAGEQKICRISDQWLYDHDIREGGILDEKEYALYVRFEFRDIRTTEGNEAAEIEKTCFPPNEACSPEQMKARAQTAPDTFLVAVDKKQKKIAGFLNGLATEETVFRDEFFRDAKLHDPKGSNILLLGLDILPEYRRQGLARELMNHYKKREKTKGRKMLVLTCLEEKIKMYEKMGFVNRGISGSVWGGEKWYEMECVL